MIHLSVFQTSFFGSTDVENDYAVAEKWQMKLQNWAIIWGLKILRQSELKQTLPRYKSAIDEFIYEINSRQHG